MKRKSKKYTNPKVPQFIVLNEYCQVFYGLKEGYPDFSDDLNEAKLLENEGQFKMIQRGTLFKLEKEYV